MSKRPTVLITNDDGIDAPGIKHLWNALKDIADAIIVAPSEEQSGVGLCMTLRRPLQVAPSHRFENSIAWSVSGTPVDCVKIALSVLLSHPPDIIVSGINRGTNSGRNVLYSGTVGGAIEGALREIPSIAFSCHEYNPNYAWVEKYIAPIVQHAMEHALPLGTFLNVNFPVERLQPIKGFKLTRQGKEYWLENPDKRYHPTEKEAYYWLGAKAAKYEEEADCDVAWLREGYITAVPIHIAELTDHQHMKARKDHFEQLFNNASN